jgi:hypothetical protein
VIEGKGGKVSVGAGWAPKDLVTVGSGARSAADIGANGVVESYRVPFTKTRGEARAAAAVAPKTNFALS